MEKRKGRRTAMKKRKYVSGLIMVLILSLIITPMASFAGEGDEGNIGEYVEVDDAGDIDEGVPGTDNPEQTITDVTSGDTIKYSKSIVGTHKKNEYEITLDVVTTEKLEPKVKPSSAVLVVDISREMDEPLEYMGGKTKWQVYKEEMKDFIEEFLEAEGNQVSIVVYGGIISGVDPPQEVDWVLCDWTTDTGSAIATFDKYNVVDKRNASEGEEALGLSVFYGYSFLCESNGEAGLKGANKILGKLDAIESKNTSVIFMTDGRFNTSYTHELFPYEMLNLHEGDVIIEAEEIKKTYPENTLYTIGLSEDSYENNAMHKDTNPHIDEEHFAYTERELIDVFNEIQKGIKDRNTSQIRPWTVKDPMSKWVNMDAASLSDTTSASIVGDTINWDLSKAKPTVSTDGTTTYKYSLKYKVTLDTSVEGFKYDTFYPTNKKTELTYAFSDKQDGGDQIAQFKIPTVKAKEDKPSGSITKVDNVDNVKVGDTYTYTITATNDKDADATWENVIATDQLPAGVDYVSSDGSSKGVTVGALGKLVTIDFGHIPAGESKSATITVTANSDAEVGKNITNIVTAKSGNDEDKTATEDTPVIETPIPTYPVGSITKVASKSKVKPGEEFDYTINITNGSGATEAWKSVNVTDTLPGQIEFVSGDSGVTGTSGGSSVSIAAGDLDIDESKSYTFKVKVKDNVTSGTAIKNTVVAQSDNDDDKTATDENVTVEDAITAEKITKSTKSGKVEVGDEYEYTIKVENSSEATETWKNVTVTDTLPSHIVFASSDDDKVSGTKDERNVNIDFGDIAIGEEKTATFKVKVVEDTDIGTKIENTATAKGSNGGTIQSTDKTPVVVAPKGSISKSTTATAVKVGDKFKYRIVVVNDRSATAPWKNVVVTDTLPDSLTYVPHASVAGITVDPSGKKITIDFGDLAIGEGKSIDITVEVTDKAVVGKNIINTVVAESDNSNPLEGKDETPNVIAQDPAGTISKTTTATSVKVGDEYRYTITASNSDKATAPWKNVIGTDPLPEGLDYVGSTTVGNVTSVGESNGVVTINFGDIGIGENKVAIITVKVNDKAKKDQQIKNTVIAKSDNEDPKTGIDETPKVYEEDVSGGEPVPETVPDDGGDDDDSVLGEDSMPETDMDDDSDDDDSVLGEESAPDTGSVKGEEARTADVMDLVPWLIIMLIVLSIMLVVALKKRNEQEPQK